MNLNTFSIDCAKVYNTVILACKNYNKVTFRLFIISKIQVSANFPDHTIHMCVSDADAHFPNAPTF